jgi:hypothetical protein
MKISRLWRLATCSLACVTSSLGHAAELTLVEDGRPKAVLVVPAEPPTPPPPANPKAKAPPVPKSKWLRAAEALQSYIEKMSGARLPLLVEGQADESGMPIKIAVGDTKLAAENGIRVPRGFKGTVGDPRAFEEEAFRIETKGNLIVIGGNSDGPYQGTLYAAYDFLERLGCRWYFPGEWGEVVPEKKTVTVPDLKVESRPDFALRNVSIGGWVPSTPAERAQYLEWAVKIKWSEYGGAGDQFYPNVGDGFLAFLVNPNDHFPDHPEYYAQNKDGTPSVPPKRGKSYFVNGTMLNLSSPEVFDLSVKFLRKLYSENDKLNGFGISPPDATAYDYRPESIALNQNFDYPTYVHSPMSSEPFFGFAAKLAREFPDKWLSTMAYSTREMPPQGVKLPPNVRVNYAPISTCVLHPCGDAACWRRQETLQILKQWTKLTPHVDMYDYNPGFLLGSFLPERDVANFAVNAKLYKATGMKGVRAEGRKAFMQTWISYYVRGMLMWDVNADVEAIKKDFYHTFFGEQAGALVQQWWDSCEAALAATTMHCHEDWLVNHVYTTAFTRRIHSYVEQAAKTTMTPKQRERFNAFALIADHLEAFAAKEEAEQKLDYAEAEKQALRMEDDKLKLIELYSFFIGNGKNPEFSSGQAQRFAELQQNTRGAQGTLIAEVPLQAKFQRDRFNEGVVAEWYLPGFDDSGWKTKNTFLTWDAQDPPEDSKGHDFDGYGWYRFNLKVPPEAAGKPLKLFLGGVINEGWVWINGDYVGHRPWYLWWAGRKRLEMEVDATGLVKAGDNVVTVRVWNNAEIGGLLRRGFLWAPKEAEATKRNEPVK